MTDQPAVFHLSATAPGSAARARFAAFLRSPWLYVLLSLAVLAPCYWQPRVQAGDLSSHIYNAWLAQLIENGRAQGLVIVSQATNILFDLMLAALFKAFGPEAAQRIAVSIAVLVFVWGAFAFASVVSRRRPWHMFLCIAMLAYGWVFHMGFFNFYLSLGLCFWVLALLWAPTRRRIAAAVVLAALAYVAHALPVVWTMGLVAFLYVARRVSLRGRAAVTAGCLVALVLLHLAISRMLVTRWSVDQVVVSTGLDQVRVFDAKYYVVLAGLVMVWGLLFLEMLHRTGGRRVVSGIPFHICLVSVMAVSILPGAVLIPGFHHALVYIAERMSLGVGICVCALLACARPVRAVRAATVLVAALYFGFLYRDERALNAFEDRMQDTVAHLAPGLRVVNGIDDPELRANALTHMIDRECVGRCFSYANYEPSTAQFRIRLAGRSPLVVDNYGKSFDLQHGTYVPKQRDLPLYKLDLENGRMVVRQLKAGAPCGSTFWKALPDLLSKS
jgi:hypothetical protein